jgi:hypothetical protein
MPRPPLELLGALIRGGERELIFTEALQAAAQMCGIVLQFLWAGGTEPK